MPRATASNLPVGGLWHADSVQDVAQSLGLTSLSDDVATALAGDVEYRLHDIIEEALKFAHHSKRTNLTSLDIDLALRAKNIEPLFGFLSTTPGGGTHAEYKRLKLPSGSTTAPSATNASTGGSAAVYYLQDEEIDLAKVLATPLPPVPREVSYTAHWLAIEGVQPAIPQNPLPQEIAALTKSLAPDSSANKRSGAIDSNRDNASIDVRPLVKHVLSRELQLYFDRVTAACMDNDPALRTAALAAFRSDTGLSGLVPYLVQWAAEKVVETALPLLGSSAASDAEAGFVMDCSLAAVFAMLQNKTMFVEPYLHQIMPTVLTCLINDALPSSLVETRSQAASLLSYILGTFASSYPSLRPRVLKTLLRALIEADRTTSARLGAVMGITSLGKEAVANVLSQEANLVALGNVLNTSDGGADDANACAQHIVDALLTLRDSAEDTAMDVTEINGDSEAMITKYGSVLGRALSQRPDALKCIARSSTT